MMNEKRTYSEQEKVLREIKTCYAKEQSKQTNVVFSSILEILIYKYNRIMIDKNPILEMG